MQRPTYAIRWATAAEKQLARIDRRAQLLIRSHVDALADDPRPLGAKAMQPPYKGATRIRIGDYRVIYTVDDKKRVVEVIRVGNRGDIY